MELVPKKSIFAVILKISAEKNIFRSPRPVGEAIF